MPAQAAEYARFQQPTDAPDIDLTGVRAVIQVGDIEIATNVYAPNVTALIEGCGCQFGVNAIFVDGDRLDEYTDLGQRIGAEICTCINSDEALDALTAKYLEDRG